MTATQEQHATGGPSVRGTARMRGQFPAQPHSADQVHAVLRTLPSHGWPAGWTGRRDRALLVLSHIAGLSYGQIAALSAGDMTISGGVAIIRTTGGRTTLRAADDCLVCGPCALARWVHALDLTVVYPDGRVIATVIARAVPLTENSPHLCDSNNAITEITARSALLPPIDQWGHSLKMTIPSAGPAMRTAATSRGHSIQALRTHRGVGVPTDDAVARASGLELRVKQLLDDVALV
jgi:hypothetical protein